MKIALLPQRDFDSTLLFQFVKEIQVRLCQLLRLLQRNVMSGPNHHAPNIRRNL